ncbi:hypothetical protein DFH06DRAFT_1128769 [Mycena polygramma]|nr:hypothetical protein DFH06DRAFT_1128769 [Mycena polygramma]
MPPMSVSLPKSLVRFRAVKGSCYHFIITDDSGDEVFVTAGRSRTQALVNIPNITSMDGQSVDRTGRWYGVSSLSDENKIIGGFCRGRSLEGIPDGAIQGGTSRQKPTTSVTLGDAVIVTLKGDDKDLGWCSIEAYSANKCLIISCAAATRIWTRNMYPTNSKRRALEDWERCRWTSSLSALEVGVSRGDGYDILFPTNMNPGESCVLMHKGGLSKIEFTQSELAILVLHFTSISNWSWLIYDGRGIVATVEGPPLKDKVTEMISVGTVASDMVRNVEILLCMLAIVFLPFPVDGRRNPQDHSIATSRGNVQ